MRFRKRRCGNFEGSSDSNPPSHNLQKPERCLPHSCCAPIFHATLQGSRLWLGQCGFERPRRARSPLRRKWSSSTFLAVVSFPFSLESFAPANILVRIADEFSPGGRFRSRDDDACLVFAPGLFVVVQLFTKEPRTIPRLSPRQIRAKGHTTGHSRGSSPLLYFLSPVPRSLQAVPPTPS